MLSSLSVKLENVPEKPELKMSKVSDFKGLGISGSSIDEEALMKKSKESGPMRASELMTGAKK